MMDVDEVCVNFFRVHEKMLQKMEIITISDVDEDLRAIHLEDFSLVSFFTTFVCSFFFRSAGVIILCNQHLEYINNQHATINNLQSTFFTLNFIPFGKTFNLDFQ